MNHIDHPALAPLVRGLCVNASGQPRVVIPDVAEDIPSQAFTVDISAAWETGHCDPAAAAKVLREAYAAWEFEMAPAGAEAASKPEFTKRQPSCMAVKISDTIRAVYWIDRDFDAAVNRKNRRDTSLLEDNIPAGIAGICPPEAQADHRSDVVRNRIALVTGGAQGFGEEIVRALAASGALVFIADLNLPGAEKLAAQINAAERRTAAIAAEVNVADENSVEALFKTIAKTAGGLDLCISNAGVLKAGSVLEQNLGDFQFVTGVNYTGFFLTAKHAGRLLRLQNRTALNWKTDIIQINSKSGLEGSNKNGAYAGGKFGAIGLTASFAMELVEYNIKVNAVCPGNFLDGPLWSDKEKGLFVQYLNTGKVPGARSVADVRAFYEAKVPMKRGCTGADVMRAIYYIVEQEYETGQAVPVTGGQVMLH
ncbi:MAG: SDR family NAD(P)-dependent oxidoreductase [Spirochaetaceae bacterium]|jgi:sorbitol-6-phosphate 2-dehydrogenase|nr:SDR family NAD(P)-dependent oxidoreductase [Spirochaetaceae bacterium]